MRIDPVRAERIGRVLSRMGLNAFLSLEEMDPQYRAVRKIARLYGEGPAALYSILVGLVSFRLAMKGEEWWECLARLLPRKRRSPPSSIKDVVDDVIWFLDNCRGSVLSRDSKRERVKRAGSRAGPRLREVMRAPGHLFREPEAVLREIARCVGGKVTDKTVIFSFKMAYYALRREGSRDVPRVNLRIPVDLRVSCISYSSMLVEAASYKQLLSRPSLVQDAWDLVSRHSGIPTLNLDSLIWQIGWAPRDLSLEEARLKVASLLSRVTDNRIAAQVSYELVRRRC